MSIESVMPSNHLILYHPLLLPSIFPASGSFPVSQFFASGGQTTRASGLPSVLSVTIQGLFPLGLTGLIPLLSKGFLRVFSSITVQKHQLFVKGKLSIGVWIYLWAFYFVPLIYISVSVPVPYCLDDCSFVV